MPISQRGVGRDHNPGTTSIWMAGARIKGGQVIGSSDEWGYKAQEQPISYHDLHGTILHLLGTIRSSPIDTTGATCGSQTSMAH